MIDCKLFVLNDLKNLSLKDEGCSMKTTIEMSKLETGNDSTSNQAKHIQSGLVCVICLDPVSSAQNIIVPCPSNHSYDKSCLRTLINHSSMEESLYPAKCCDTIVPVDILQKLFTSVEMQIYKKKEEEYSIPSRSRLYCSNSSCSKWIGTKSDDSKKLVMTCSDCKTGTCNFCFAADHGSIGCTNKDDEVVAQSLKEAFGFQRCCCGVLVVKNEGCDHM